MNINDAMNIIRQRNSSGIAKGSHEIEVEVDGVEILCTYNLVGEHRIATETDPAERPYVELISVQIGSTWLAGFRAQQWDDRLDLTFEIEQVLDNE